MSTTSFYDDDAAASRPKTADGATRRPAMLKRPTLGSRNVSFTPGVQPGSYTERPILGSRNASYAPSVQPFPLSERPETGRFNSEYSAPDPQQHRWKGDAQMQRIDRHAQNVDPLVPNISHLIQSSNLSSDLEPALPFTAERRDSPFAIYDDSFTHLLGQRPVLENILSDSRSPFFYG